MNTATEQSASTLRAPKWFMASFMIVVIAVVVLTWPWSTVSVLKIILVDTCIAYCLLGMGAFQRSAGFFQFVAPGAILFYFTLFAARWVTRAMEAPTTAERFAVLYSPPSLLAFAAFFGSGLLFYLFGRAIRRYYQNTSA